MRKSKTTKRLTTSVATIVVLAVCLCITTFALVYSTVAVDKDFFLENQGTWDVYYTLYLDNVEGGLADVLDVAIRDGDTVLYSGKAVDLQKEQIDAADDILKLNERRELTITFHYPEEGGNSGQAQYLSFDLKADAVQTKNNPQRLFD